MAAAVHGETFSRNDSIAADGQQPFAITEGSLNQDFSQITRLVNFLIRNQGDLLLFYITGWWSLPAAHPTGNAALILPSFGICYYSCDLVTSTNGCFELTADSF